MVTITEVQKEFLIRRMRMKEEVKAGQMAYHAPEAERAAAMLWSSLAPEAKAAVAKKDPGLAKRMNERGKRG